MRKPGTTFIGLAVIVVIIGALAAWVLFQSPRQRSPNRPDASVTFLGYTNDAPGRRLARFAVTNLSALAVARSPKCLIWIAPSAGGWAPQSVVLFPGFPRSRVLGAGTSEIVTIAPPTNQSPWRISLYVSDDVGPAWIIKRLVNAALLRVGLPARYGIGTWQVDSGRIENQR